MTMPSNTRNLNVPDDFSLQVASVWKDRIAFLSSGHFLLLRLF